MIAASAVAFDSLFSFEAKEQLIGFNGVSYRGDLLFGVPFPIGVNDLLRGDPPLPAKLQADDIWIVGPFNAIFQNVIRQTRRRPACYNATVGV